ncbi:MAG: hypothetical protein ACKVXR_03610 [Planctomycetota bacterium]
MLDTSKRYSGLVTLLVQEGFLSESAAAELDLPAGTPWASIGSVLIERGKLTMDDLAALLEMQTLEPHLRLGEIAVREAYCTSADVEQALWAQAAASRPPLDLLLAEIQGDRERLCRVLLRYIAQLEARLPAQQLMF